MWIKSAIISVAAFFALSNAIGQEFQVRHHFTKEFGRPQAPLVLGADGALCGGASAGVFAITPGAEKMRIVARFKSNPTGPLAFVGNTVFAVTRQPDASGSILRIDSDKGTVRPLFGFRAKSEPNPLGGLLPVGGQLYGVVRGDKYSPGAIYAIDPAGKGFRWIKEFTGADGRWPSAPLTGRAKSDAIFGVTESGGAGKAGTIFRLGLRGKGFATLHEFSGADGAAPAGSLLLNATGLFGTTSRGGKFGHGTLFYLKPAAAGVQVLWHFNGANGSRPVGNLVQLGDTLYGVTQFGGGGNLGLVYSLNLTTGEYVALESFGGQNGANPTGGLVAAGKRLIGVTPAGGENNAGVLFTIDLEPGEKP